MFSPKMLTIIFIYKKKLLVHYRHFFGNSEENLTIFLVTKIFIKSPFWVLLNVRDPDPVGSRTFVSDSELLGQIRNSWSDLDLFGRIRTRSETLFLRPKIGPWQHCSCAWIKIVSFPLPDDEKITKGLAHCEERPAPYVTTNEKCVIFSNSAAKIL
jgi:hypothetical protein